MAGRHRRTSGRHRKPVRHLVTGRTAARAVVLGAGVLGPVGLNHAVALAGPDGGWGPVIACESSGDPEATNKTSTASGLFQFLDSSWRYYGGTVFASRAMYATPAQQTQIADTAYAQDGLRPWASSRPCWATKIGSTAPAAPTKPSWQAAARAYTVRLGDTLSGIAGTRTTWQQLYAANRGVIGANPDLLLPGQHLLV